MELSSPACSMHEADDQYMGYAGKDELITFLNELLEAERAGAQITLESARAAGSGPISDLMRTVQQDEARWCGMLLGHIKALGEVPSPRSASSMARPWLSRISLNGSPSSIAARAGWCESCAKCSRVCVTIDYMPIFPRCCARTRPILPSRRTLSPTRRNRGAALSSAGESARAGPLRPSQTKSPSFCGRVRPAL